MAEKWIQGVRQKMERTGTEGAFTRQAHAVGMTPRRYATQVLKEGSRASTKTKRRAAFLKAISSIARHRKDDDD